MTDAQRLRNLEVPKGRVDVVLDTDAYNEIDDQFAITYLLRSTEKLDVKAIYAAPFCNGKVSSPAEGMEKSWEEIRRLLALAGADVPVLRGSETYLPDEGTPVFSESARDLAERARYYSPENPLYVVAIGAITNVASAMLMNPQMTENTVVVWLGGHARHYPDTREFNMRQDVAAARVVMGSGVPFVQLPCMGVVSAFSLSRPELECWFRGKNPLADYLTDITLTEMKKRTDREIWTKVIWDVTAVAWLLNEEERFMRSRVIPMTVPAYDHFYEEVPVGHSMRYVYFIEKDMLLNDLVEKIAAV